MTRAARGGWTTQSVRPSLKSVDAWWTVLVVDPIAVRVLPWVLARPWATPNALTLVAGILGVGSGAAFLLGAPVVGGVLFELSFFFDCLDGKVARLRGGGSRFGGFLDRSVDLVILTWVYSALGLWLGSRNGLPAGLSLLPAVAALVWSWSNQYLAATRQTLPAAAPVSQVPSTAFRRLMPGRRLTRLPSSVDAANLSLFLAPVTASRPVMVAALWLVTVGFFVPAAVHNFYATARLLARPENASVETDMPK